MSDIIKDAKQLLDGATPAPWEPHADQPKRVVNLETQFAVAVVPDSHVAGSEDEYNRNLIAAAPELAQALAEEEYQYGVTYIGVSHGGHHVEWVEPTGDSEWDKGTLQLLVKRWKRKGQSPKIVRRRVSPPEVME